MQGRIRGRTTAVKRIIVFRLTVITWCLVIGWISSSDAAGAWPHVHSAPPFLFHADFDLSSYHAQFAELAHLRREIPMRLAVADRIEPIHVYLFDRRSTYANYMQHYFPEAPARKALFIKDRGPGMVFAYRSADLLVDLRHECTHAVLHSLLPMVPLWLDEGLAEYFEMSPKDRYRNHPHLKELRFRSVQSLRRLERLSTVDGMEGQHYRDAWAWVHFLLHGPPAIREEFTHYIQDIQSHTPPGELASRLHRRTSGLQYRLTQHISRLR